MAVADTEAKPQSQSRPAPVRSDSEFSSSMDNDNGSDADTGYQSRSRSESRRRRRQNQRQRQSLQKNQSQQTANYARGSAQSGGAKAQSEAMAPIQEQPETTMQPFEWIGPDSTSMGGPVTYARAMRGEIPMRPGNPNQGLATAGRKQGKSLDEEEGLKLKLELNLDVEVELKAKLYGDLTLALLA